MPIEDQKDFGKSPEAEVRRWLLELKQADKRESAWRKTGKEIYKRYRAEGRKKNSFNILWANTETLRPSLYNSIPKPDVRRRFRDKDAVGKAVSEILERGLTYSCDCGKFDEKMKLDVLDALLPGRGLSRVKYVPSIKESAEGAALEYEQVELEHVNWEDFRRGTGRIWEEVQWVGFRHRLTKDEIKEKFGEDISEIIKMDTPADEDLNKKENEDIQGVFSTAEFWEIWDKQGDQVFFINQSYRQQLLTPIDADGVPLKLKGFFPTPCPLRLIEDSETLIPTPLYEEYREQADELDNITARINKIVRALRVRGIYDATLTEIGELLKGEDNDLVAISNAAMWADRGGIEKAIWWMPTEQAAKVLLSLYEARDACKQTIYEITGISDIVRGASNPNETLGAQKIKNQWGTLRLQRLQREVQRYARDLICLMGEVIADKFSPETLAKMTGLQFPTAQQKQEAQLMVQGVQQSGQQQVPPQVQEMLSLPTWEDIIQVMRSDPQREYRVDIETDSTVASLLEDDVEGLQQVLTGIVQFVEGVAPAVQSGAFPIEAVKAIIMTICRRSRMGLEVEDALEKIQAPKPAADPNAAAAEAEKMKLQQEAQLEQQRMQQEMQTRQMEMQAEQQKNQQEMQLEAVKFEHEKQMEAITARLEEQANMQQIAFDQWKAELEAQTKLTIARMQAESSERQHENSLSVQADQADKDRKVQSENKGDDE